MSTAAQLCNELVQNASISGNRALERRLADLSVWYYKNAFFLPPENLKARLDFMHKALWTMVEVNALLVERLHDQEGSKSLWLPSGLDVRGDLRTFK